MRLKTWRCVAVVGVALIASGCASDAGSRSNAPSTRPSPATANPASAVSMAGHGECLVCKHNADLACVDVEVDKDTPRMEYAGKTYYFCSEKCKQEFEKDPQKYAARR